MPHSLLNVIVKKRESNKIKAINVASSNMRNTLHETLDASSSLIETVASAVSLEVIRAKEPLHPTSCPFPL